MKHFPLPTRGAVVEALRDGMRVVCTPPRGRVHEVVINGNKIQLIDANTCIVIRTNLVSRWKDSRDVLVGMKYYAIKKEA